MRLMTWRATFAGSYLECQLNWVPLCGWLVVLAEFVEVQRLAAHVDGHLVHLLVVAQFEFESRT